MNVPAIAGGVAGTCALNRLVFGAPVIGEEEIASVVECLRSNWIGLGARVEQLRAGVRALQGRALTPPP